MSGVINRCKHGINFAVAIILAMCVISTGSPADDIESFKEVNFKVLRANPEDFEGKNVRFQTVYKGHATGLDGYMTASGFNITKHYKINVDPDNLPLMAKKTQKLLDMLILLEPGVPVIVKGRVKVFKISSTQKRFPNFYIDLHSIKLVKPPKKLDDRKLDDDSEQSEKVSMDTARTGGVINNATDAIKPEPGKSLPSSQNVDSTRVQSDSDALIGQIDELLAQSAELLNEIKTEGKTVDDNFKIMDICVKIKSLRKKLDDSPSLRQQKKHIGSPSSQMRKTSMHLENHCAMLEC